ncbi:MAG: tetratricopeptide repeat protein [Planctomycetes bacterium]|nr:tetratricopeptide repeat protein [Planctomycetota bacterium]
MPSPVRALVAALVSVSVASAQDTRAPEAYQLAIGLQQRGLHEEAVRRFEEFLQANPRHALAAEGHYRLAQSLVELQQAPAAMRALSAALQVGGAQFRLQAEARYRLAELQLQAGQHEAAAASFEQLE